ncbi:hypothetical protein APHAL10511_006074 [Amanita phalloides]|nr:hypothetical protein APHAL10511_006074 [Amanita phalloides]
MHSTGSHSSYSYIKTLATKHDPQDHHTRILSRFFLPSTSVDSSRAMKAMSGSLAEADNKLKHLHDDPAFSPDPTSNPLCAASHDISSWVADPPKGHPVMRSREAYAGEVILIQPPNSPVYVNPLPQPIIPMIRLVQSIPVSPPSTSVPDLSSTASSASDSSLPTSSASHSSSSLTTTTSAPPAASTKKRIDLPFFKRKTLPMPNTDSQTPLSSSQIQRRTNRTPNPTVNGSAPSPSHQSATGQARELDMIDELDETNPLGVALHHGGPYEGIQRMMHPVPQAQQAYRPNQQFRFDVSLNLSPGQFLPHSVTPYYRPRTLGPVRNIHQRLRLATAQGQVGQSATNCAPEPVTKQYSTDHPVPRSAPDHMDHKRPYTHRHVSSDPAIVLDTNRFQGPGPFLPGGPPPPVGGGRSTSTNTEPILTRDVNSAQYMANPNNYYQNPHAGANGESWMQHITGPIDPRVTPMAIAHREELRQNSPHSLQRALPVHEEYIGPPAVQDHHMHQHQEPRQTLSREASNGHPSMAWNAEERRQNSPHGLQRALPAHEEHIGPPAVQDHHRHQELRQALSRAASNSHPSTTSSSSSIHSGASSVITGMTTATASSRRRILPRQLVMPAPLAKAAISSRPQPTHTQRHQHWQNTPRQHRIRFGDGTEYELPVTNMESTMITPAVMPPANPPTRTMSLSSNGKLKKQPSFRGPEPPEIVARLAAAKAVLHKGKYMEPPPTIPEAPRIDPPVSRNPVKQEMRRLLSKRRTAI